MPLNEKELLDRDATRDIGSELLGAIRDFKKGHYGETYQVQPNEIAETRMRCKMSQSEFANALDISSRTLQQWEQGRRKPLGAAKTLLKIIAKHPEILSEVR